MLHSQNYNKLTDIQQTWFRVVFQHGNGLGECECGGLIGDHFCAMAPKQVNPGLHQASGLYTLCLGVHAVVAPRPVLYKTGEGLKI